MLKHNKTYLYLFIDFFFLLFTLICISCYPRYTEYTYKTTYNDSSNIHGIVHINVNIYPKGYKTSFGYMLQTASNPYLFVVGIRGELNLYDSIEIDKIFIIVNDNTINLFESDFLIYDSSQERFYTEDEKESFILNHKIETYHISESNKFFNLVFENIDIQYSDVSSFKLKMNLIYHYDNKFTSREITFVFNREKNSKYILPST